MTIGIPRVLIAPAFLSLAGLASAQTATVRIQTDNANPGPSVVVQDAPQPNGKLEPAPAPQLNRRTTAVNGRSGEFLGIYASPVHPAMAAQLKLKPKTGMVVEGVIPGSAAERAGIQQYDIVTAVEGQPFSGPQ